MIASPRRVVERVRGSLADFIDVTIFLEAPRPSLARGARRICHLVT
jgi:hypothetical protein